MLQTFSSNRDDAIRENLELGRWLAARTTFQEVRDVMPELVRRRFFCAAIGVTFGEKIYNPDRLSFELSLGGNYFPDLVIGDATTKDLVLVESEGAERHQIYSRQKSGEQYPDFSPKFRVGFFQLLDWIHRLKDASQENKLDWFTFLPKPSGRFSSPDEIANLASILIRKSSVDWNRLRSPLCRVTTVYSSLLTISSSYR